MILQYKCPNCGADMVFDAEKGTLFCESCENAMAVEEYPVGDFEEFEEMTSASTFGDDSATQYQCKNCGAILITDADTAATSCSFCGAPMILSDRLSGQMAPAKVIPFKVSKEQAQAAFKKWCRGGLLTPKGFMSADRIKILRECMYHFGFMTYMAAVKLWPTVPKYIPTVIAIIFTHRLNISMFTVRWI